jgi:predicted dehydrogenase
VTAELPRADGALAGLPDPAALRVGIVGAGFMAATHAAAWRALGVSRLEAFAPDADHLATFTAETGARPRESLQALVAGADIVDVCSPTHVHREGVEAAAAAGRHVICEKPLARTASDGAAMIESCSRAGVRLFVAHVVRYFNEYAVARAAVDDGRVGRPAVLRFRREGFRPRRAADHWFFDEERSGGLILDLMIHDFDAARWFGGEVESVMARRVRDASGADVDYAIALLRHTSGAITHVTGAWAYPSPTFRTGFEVAGDAGLIEFESVDQQPITRYLLPSEGERADPAVGLPLSPTDEDPYTQQLADFLRALATAGEARVSPADGLAAVRIALAAIESSRSGQPVPPAEVA